MPHRMDNGEWGSGSWGAQGSGPAGWAPGAPTGAAKGAPASGSFPTGRVVLILSGVLAVFLVAGLLAAGTYLVVNRDSGTVATAGAAADTEATAGAAADRDPGAESASGGWAPAAGGGAAQDPAGGPEFAPASGTYSGTLSQRGTRRSDRDYPVEMTFSSQGSTVAYPTLGCRGTLTPTGNSAGARVYRETITSGRCDPMGTWYVTTGSDQAVSAEYHPSNADYVVVGQLTR